jgi:hypothetical protein
MNHWALRKQLISYGQWLTHSRLLRAMINFRVPQICNFLQVKHELTFQEYSVIRSKLFTQIILVQRLSAGKLQLQAFTCPILSKHVRRSVNYPRQIYNANLQVLQSLALLSTPSASAQVNFAFLKSKTVLVHWCSADVTFSFTEKLCRLSCVISEKNVTGFALNYWYILFSLWK